jgi:HNH endonuclease
MATSTLTAQVGDVIAVDRRSRPRMATCDLRKTEMRPNRRSLARFFSKVSIASSGCWTWVGARSQGGYGSFWLSDEQMQTTAHRVAYRWFSGPIGLGEVVDHLCRNPNCVNPAHLEAVSQSVNVARGLCGDERPTCKRGHLMSPGNIVMQRNYGEVFRTCATCRALRESRRRDKRRALRLEVAACQ